MLNLSKKIAILLLILTVSGLAFVVVSGDELPPLQPPQQSPQEAPQEPIHSPPQESKAPEPPTLPQDVPQPPQPPAPPSEKNIAKDEIWHAYIEFQEVNEILSNSQTTEEVRDLEDLAKQFYIKSEKLYEAGKYKESKVYAHLAIEALHGVKDIMREG